MKITHFIQLNVILSLLIDQGMAEEKEEDTFNESYTNGTVRLVQVLYRHGDRSPTHTYANDLYNESHWPQGYGQLSQTGMQQEFELGQFLRNHYIKKLNFLTNEYMRKEVYVRSTSLDRALMSAYSFLSGLYPPGPREWNTSMGWQPIPVHTVPLEEDYLLFTDTPCPVVQEANKNKDSNPEVLKIMKKHEHFFSYVSNFSGEPNTWSGVGKVLDPLFCQSVTENTPLPDWVTNDILQELLELRDLYTRFWIPKGYEFLKGGVLLKQMTEHMVNKSRNDESIPQKLFVYSAHDSTVIALLEMMGLFNYRQPPYTACVILELIESATSQFFVRVWYRNESDHVPYLRKIEHCDSTDKCPLEKFVALFKSSLPVDIKKECGLGENSKSYFEHLKSPLGVNILLVCGILLLIVLLLVFMFRTCEKGRSSRDYMPVPTEMSEFS